jgi:uncharacterized protein DUF2786
MDIERVVVRVAQLLRLARDQSSKPEGVLAGQVARQLMDKYNVDVQLTDAVSEKTTEFFRTLKHQRTTMSQILVNLLACSAFEIEAEQHEDGEAAWILTAPDPLVPRAQKLGKRLHTVLLREVKSELRGFGARAQFWVLGMAAIAACSIASTYLEGAIEATRQWNDELDEESTALVRYRSKINVPHYEQHAAPAQDDDPQLTELPRRAGEKLGRSLGATFWDIVRKARREAGF